MIYQSWYRSDHLAEVMFVSFLRSKLIHYCYYFIIIIIIIIILGFSKYILQRKVTLCIAHLRVGSYAHELEGGMSAQIV